jgi:hypothetical protein
MRFIPGHHGALDKVGGLPTHLPATFPTNNAGQPLRFLAQFYCDGVRLRLDGTLCLQVYQDIPDGDPIPVIVRVPPGAELNSAQLGVPDPAVIPHDIEWEYREDPDDAPDWRTDLASSKLGGVCYFPDAIDPDERLLLFLDERPAGFNFGGDELMLAINHANVIRVACA